MARTFKHRVRSRDGRKTLKGGHTYGTPVDCVASSISHKILQRRLVGDMFHDANISRPDQPGFEGNSLFTRILVGRYRLLFGGAYPRKGEVAYAEIVHDPDLLRIGIPANFSEWSLFESILGSIKPINLAEPPKPAALNLLTNWDERRRRAIRFTIDNETSYMSDDSGVRLYADIQNSQVGIVHDALHPVFKQLGAANLITFGSILDQAQKPWAQKDDPVYYPHPGGEVSYNLCEYGFGPFLSQLVITGFTGDRVSCKFRGLLSMSEDGEQFCPGSVPMVAGEVGGMREIDAISMNKAGRSNIKPINKTDPAVSGFFTSNAEIVRVEMAVRPDMDKILYYAGKALGDTSLVMSATRDLGPSGPNPMLSTDLQYIYPAGRPQPPPLHRYIVKTHDILEAVTAATKDEAFILENMGGYTFIPGYDNGAPIVAADPAAAAARLLAEEKLRLTAVLQEQGIKIRDSYQNVITAFNSTIGRSIYTNSASAETIPVNQTLIRVIISALTRLQNIYLAEYTRVHGLIAQPGAQIPAELNVTTLSAKFKGILACKNQVLARVGAYYFNSRIVISKHPDIVFSLSPGVLTNPLVHRGESLFMNFLHNIYTSASITGYLTDPAIAALVEVPSSFNLLAGYVAPQVDHVQLATDYAVPPIIVLPAETDDDAIARFADSGYPDDIKANVTASIANIRDADIEHDLTPVVNKLLMIKKTDKKINNKVTTLNTIKSLEKTVEQLEARKRLSKLNARDISNLSEQKSMIIRLRTELEGKIPDKTMTRSATLLFKAKAEAVASVTTIVKTDPADAFFLRQYEETEELPIVREKPGCFPYFQRCLEYVGTSVKKLVVMVATAYTFRLNPLVTTDRVILQHLYEEISDDDFNGVQKGGALQDQPGPIPWELAMINAFCCDFNATQFANLGYINGINAPPVKNYDSIIVKSFQQERDQYLSAIGMKMNAEGTAVEPATINEQLPLPFDTIKSAHIDLSKSGVRMYSSDEDPIPIMRTEVPSFSNPLEISSNPIEVGGGQRVSPEKRTIDATKSGVRTGGSLNTDLK